jgi:hypothetical protein
MFASPSKQIQTRRIANANQISLEAAGSKTLLAEFESFMRLAVDDA